MNKSTSNIDLSRLLKLTKGEELKMLQYLNQFLDLIPEKVIELKNYLANQNREKTRELIHHIGPHLIFFDVPEVKKILKLIEEEIEFMPTEEFQKRIEELLLNIEKATSEIKTIVMNKANNQ